MFSRLFKIVFNADLTVWHLPSETNKSPIYWIHEEAFIQYNVVLMLTIMPLVCTHTTSAVRLLSTFEDILDLVRVYEKKSDDTRRWKVAKIKKRQLRWTASESPQTVGYKLYWAENEKVTYDSQCVRVGDVTTIVLPDDVEAFRPQNGPIEFGIAAVDELGNESDLITISAPYQFSAPQAPEEIWIEHPEDNVSPSAEVQEDSTQAESISLLDSTITPLEQTNSPSFAGSATEVDEARESVTYIGLPEAK